MSTIRELLSYIKTHAVGSFTPIPITFQLRASHILFILSTGVLCSDYFDCYSRFRQARSVFERNYKSINNQYKNDHYQATNKAISLKGLPDGGDWLYWRRMDEGGRKEYEARREEYQKGLGEFSCLMGLILIGGVGHPILMTGLNGVYHYGRFGGREWVGSNVKVMMGVLSVLSIIKLIRKKGI